MENNEQLARQIFNQNVSKISTELLPCGMLLGAMDHVVTDKIDVAAVGYQGGKIIRYTNAENWLSYSESERLFIDIHEWWHPTLLHFKRRDGRDHILWNIACDCELNPLVSSKFSRPVNALMPEDFGCNRYMTAEQIYEQLLKNPPPDLDKLKLTADMLDKMKEAAKNSNHKYGAFAAMYGDRIENEDMLEGAERAVGKEIKALLSSNNPMMTKMFGKMPGQLQNIIKGYYQSKSHYSFEDFANEFGRNYYVTSNKRKNKWGLPWGKINELSRNIWVAIDTSSSVIDESLKKSIGELKEVMLADENNTITVFCIDTEIQSIQDIQDVNFDNMEISGRGGTSFNPIYEVAETLYVPKLNYTLENEPDVIIYYTDGWANAPEEELVDTLWVITQDKTHSVKPTTKNGRQIDWGKYMYID